MKSLLIAYLGDLGGLISTVTSRVISTMNLQVSSISALVRGASCMEPRSKKTSSIPPKAPARGLGFRV